MKKLVFGANPSETLTHYRNQENGRGDSGFSDAERFLVQRGPAGSVLSPYSCYFFTLVSFSENHF